jgi:hypothetical protein
LDCHGYAKYPELIRKSIALRRHAAKFHLPA